MAKRKDDSFDLKASPAREEASEETPADEETPGDSSDSSDSSTADASAETPAEETPAEEQSQDTAAAEGPQVKEHKQFRILVMGDFSGRANRQIMETGEAISTRKVRAIDSDSFDKVMAAVKAEIQLPVSDKTAVRLKFQTMEDFRPDALLGQIEAFAGMLKLRDQLKNPKTFKAAAEAVRKLTGEKKAKASAGGKAAPKGAQAGSDFERLMSQPVAPRDAQAATAEALIASLVAGYEVPATDPDEARLVQLVEEALAAGLRAVLRHPAFQAVESSWRGVEFLTNRLNTDEDLKICVLDISREELLADLNSAATVEKAGIFQVLVEQTKVPGVQPFSLVVGNYYFDQTAQEIATLVKLATLMHAAGIPFIGGGTAKIAGLASFGKFPDSGRWQPPADIAIWDKIRAHKFAAHLGLTAPRFLMRLPYGPKTDAVEAFAFEEMPGNSGGAGAEGYLWGNGAFAAALCMGEGFLESGWGFDPQSDVTDLPCHMVMVDGEKEMTPCAEGWLSDRMAAVLHDLGLIPLLSVRNAASVKVAGVHSIAKDGKPLAASWAQT